MTAHGDDLVHCHLCNALYNCRERSKCPGCVFNAERALDQLRRMLNECRANGVELRAGDSPVDLTDIGTVWIASFGNHHVRRAI